MREKNETKKTLVPLVFLLSFIAFIFDSPFPIFQLRYTRIRYKKISLDKKCEGVKIFLIKSSNHRKTYLLTGNRIEMSIFTSKKKNVFTSLQLTTLKLATFVCAFWENTWISESENDSSYFFDTRIIICLYKQVEVEIEYFENKKSWYECFFLNLFIYNLYFLPCTHDFIL